MPLSLAYWVLLLIWIIIAANYGWRTPPETRFLIGGSFLLELLILLVIGLKLFGAPLRGG